MPRLLGPIVFAACVFGASSAAAQTTEPIAIEPPRVGVDGLLGGLWPITTDEDSTPFTGGGRFVMYLGESAIARRLSGAIAVNGLQVRSTKFFDAGLGSFVQSNNYVIVTNPAVGFDVLQFARVQLTVRGGGAWIVDETTFSLQRTHPDEDGSDYENVCDLEAFDQRCFSDHDFVGTASVPFAHEEVSEGVAVRRERDVPDGEAKEDTQSVSFLDLDVLSEQRGHTDHADEQTHPDR